MRPLPSVFALLLLESLAVAHPTQGGNTGGNGGALGQVSGGLRSTNPQPPPPPPPPGASDPRPRREVVYVEPVIAGGIAVGASTVPAPEVESPHRDAHVDFYLGAAKVHDSDGMWSAELALRDGQFRLAGSFTQYYEAQANKENLTLTMPALIGGYRIDDHRGPTRAYLEIGVVGAKTRNDPVMDTSITGGLGGIRLEHGIAPRTALIGTAHEMVFEQGVRAHAASVGVRVGMLQAAIRVLDFNIGPALYGPEIGLRF